MNEFELIENFFRRQDNNDNGVVLGIGDDAAIIDIPARSQLLLCMDTLVSGVHFPAETSPADIAWKALAVNLSDMAAMGASKHGLTLVGGDLSRGPLSVTVQLQGVLPTAAKCLTRAGALVGDQVYVTGSLGGAAYALRAMLEPETWSAATDEERMKLLRPLARLQTGQQLQGLATSCIDISDGLQADLLHILEASKVGAELMLDALPLSDSLNTLERQRAWDLALTGGDDYELCFTLPPTTARRSVRKDKERAETLAAICPVTRIGTISNKPGELLFYDTDKRLYTPATEPYRHF